LAVRNRVSRRDTVELCEELFGARISSGTVDAILARAGEALTEPYEQLLDSARRSKHLNVDETGWRLRGQQRTLWGAFSKRHAVFRIADSRHADHAKTLLEGHRGIVTSDRWWAYDQLPLARRQICWAHLRRDFKAHAEGIGAEREFGQAGLRITDQLFWAWEIYQHTHDRKELQRRIRLLRRELKPICRRYTGKAPRYKYCRGIARNLLKAWAALWTFARHPGVEPTNYPEVRVMPMWAGGGPLRWAGWRLGFGIIRALRGRRGACRVGGSGLVWCGVGRCGRGLVA
jgi:transposase